MDYKQLFKKLRGEKGLTLDQLAALSGVHRNTVVNVESGRQVKIDTLVDLMAKMGYAKDSPEMRMMGLLWLESVSGLKISLADAEAASRKVLATYGTSARNSARRLHEAINRTGRTAEEIDLLVYAASHPDVFTLIEAARDHAANFNADKATDLKVAEDKS
jgi:transcriptional regulator with XRE-family HTH domain